MRSDKDNIKDIFSSKLGSFEPELPPFGWEKIKAGLSIQQQEKVIPVKKKALVYRLMPWASSAAAIVLVVLFLYSRNTGNDQYASVLSDKEQISSTTSINKIWIAENKDKPEKPESPVRNLQPNTFSGRILKIQSSSHINNIQGIPTYIAEKTEEKENTIDNQEIISAVIYQKEEKPNIYVAEKGDIPRNKEIQDKEEFEKELAEKIAEFEADGKTTKYLLAENLPKGNDENYPKGIEIGINGGGAFSKATDTQNQLRLASVEILTQNGNQIINTYKSRKMKLDHNQPINFGITINKKLINRLSIESGIMYTYLSSKIRSIESMDYKLKDYQQFHYLGIPVTLNYMLAEWNKLQLYISAGGAIQKDIYGKMKTNENLESLIEMNKYKSKNISQDHPQFSLTTSVGLNYPIYKKMSVYTNLGGSYYINAKNKYETIYSDRKWIFNINLGVKFGF